MGTSQRCCAVGLAGGGAAMVYKRRAVLNPHLDRLSIDVQISAQVCTPCPDFTLWFVRC